MIKRETIEHYDALIREGNDPVYDPKTLQDCMNKWDGEIFIENLRLSAEKSVLEIGVGTGRLAIRVAPLCGEFVGIDISPKTIQRASENLSNFKNIKLICDDFADYTFSGCFDVIYSSLTFMHIENKQSAINKIAHLLNDGGRFVLSIDKNKNGFIDMGTRRIIIYPDDPKDIKTYIKNSGLILENQYETELAYIFVASNK